MQQHSTDDGKPPYIFEVTANINRLRHTLVTILAGYSGMHGHNSVTLRSHFYGKIRSC